MSAKGALLKIISFSVVLEFVLFLPLYLSRSEEGKFWPVITSIPGSLASRPNPDVFRWCLELGLFLSIYLYIINRVKSAWTDLIMSCIYFLLLAFQSYYFILWKIYGEIPIFSYDWALFVRVLPVFIKTMQIPPVLFYSVLIIISFSLIYILFNCFRYIQKSAAKIPPKAILSYTGLIFILPLSLKMLISHPAESNDTKSALVWITENIYNTFSEDRVHVLPDTINYFPYESYTDLPLKSKPNILLIFIEAYGSVIGCVPGYDSAYFMHLKEIENSLSVAGWQSATTLSNSTILGGRSWLGFTSLIAGIKIDNHPAYEKLVYRFTDYPHLINTLNAQGYHTYRLNTMANFGEDFKKIDSASGNFFKLNSDWTKFNSIPYQGYRYDYFGGIPDQYALNYWNDNVLKKDKQPYFLFFITLNTHAPFYLPPPLLTNWKDLDAIKTSPHEKVRAESGKPIERYALEVHYILSTIQQFILNKADTNSLIILIGDHQPAGMEYMINGKTDLYANPMHIITQDEKWIRLLADQGFQRGMVPKLERPSLLQHQGIYSFLMSTWAKRDSLNFRLETLHEGLKF